MTKTNITHADQARNQAVERFNTKPNNPIQRLLDAAAELGLVGQVQTAWQTDPDGARIVALTILATGVEVETGEGWHWEMWDPPEVH